VAEIGIGHFPDLALSLLGKGIRVFATDIRRFNYNPLKVFFDDITEPDISLYKGLDLLYSLRPPLELVPYMIQITKLIGSDLIVKPLFSEHPGSNLTRYKGITFFLWKNSR